MLVRLATAFGLLAVCVMIHASALTAGFRRFGSAPESVRSAGWLDTWRLIRVATWLIGAHLVEIAVWGLFYTWAGVFADAESSFYFSAVTYSTVGYGDLVPPPEWRLLAGVEGLTGILMCGWSTGFFFAVVSAKYKRGER